MRNFVIGFFMAWGNFLTIPCPYKRWDSNLKNTMLAFLPSVGAVLGLVWSIVGVLLFMLGAPVYIAAFVMTFAVFALCGFMHMDGFMDCNDAILSRRPLEDRQRILKDSTVGAFAVVTVAFLILGWFAAMVNYLMAVADVRELAVLFVIPVASRSVGAIAVLNIRPMGTSQYAEDYEKPKKGKYTASVIVQAILFAVAAAFVSGLYVETLAVIGIAFLCEIIACSYAVHNLKGMSGDIAGYTICFGELAGIIALAVISGFVF